VGIGRDVPYFYDPSLLVQGITIDIVAFSGVIHRWIGGGIGNGSIGHKIFSGIVVFMVKEPDVGMRIAGAGLRREIDEVILQSSQLIIPEMMFDVVNVEDRGPFQDVGGIAFCIVKNDESVPAACKTKKGHPGDMADGIVGIGMVVDVVKDFSAGGQCIGPDENDEQEGCKFVHDRWV